MSRFKTISQIQEDFLSYHDDLYIGRKELYKILNKIDKLDNEYNIGISKIRLIKKELNKKV